MLLFLIRSPEEAECAKLGIPSSTGILRHHKDRIMSQRVWLVRRSLTLTQMSRCRRDVNSDTDVPVVTLTYQS